MKLLLIDLDDTLIDTTSHKSEIFRELSESLGVSISQIEVLYEDQKKSGHMNGWMREFETLLSNKFHKPVGFLTPILQKTVSKIPVNQHVLKFIRASEAYKVLFSYGDYEYQQMKLQLLNLGKELDKIIITPEYKLKFLQSIINGNHIVLDAKQYTDVTVLDNDTRLNTDIHAQYPWITVIDPNDLV